MHIKALLAGAALVALAAGPAFAGVNDLGPLSDGYSHGGTLGHVKTPETGTFSLSTSEVVSLSYTVAGTTAHLDESRLVLTGPTGETDAFSIYNGSYTAGFTDTLTAGAYTFTLSPAATSGANTSVGYSISVSAVPEIATWGMMLAGFGALAFAGYRRRPIAA